MRGLLMFKFSDFARTLVVSVLKNRLFQISLFGGLAFLFFFYLSYSTIESDYYQVRDDGVITLSHAKNLVDYGFIGVSPSGDRVEGYSAPVQFVIYAAAYYLTGLDFKTYAAVQTLVSTFLLGVVFSLFFKESKFYAFGLSLLAGFILSEHTAFVQWHGSGMENPITHVLMLATILILYSSYRAEKICYPLVLVVFLATISRIDSVYHVAPILAIFAAAWLFTYKNFKGFFFAFLVFVFWLSYHLWRYYYFGDFMPNTGYAQDISIGERLANLVTWDQGYVNESLRLSIKIFSYHGGYLLLVFMPLLILVREDREVALLFLILFSLILTSYLNPFFFGQTRLDPVRSTTQLAIFVMLAIASIIYFLRKRSHLFWIAPASLLAGLFALKINAVQSYDMCCRIDYFDSFRNQFAGLANQESLPRPTVSNPDLGVMSWHKQFNIIDLGKLGTPVMAKLVNGPILGDYFFDYAAPDMIESHGWWTCQYEESIFRDPRFSEMYSPIQERTQQAASYCDGRPQLTGIWIRKGILSKSQTPERILIDDMKESLSVERLRYELGACQASPEANCVYVARTAFRFLPEFRDKGKIESLNEVFSGSSTKEYDLFLINGYQDGQAHLDAIQFISSQYAKNR